jgi:hypothetical protein
MQISINAIEILNCAAKIVAKIASANQIVAMK